MLEILFHYVYCFKFHFFVMLINLKPGARSACNENGRRVGEFQRGNDRQVEQDCKYIYVDAN